MTAGVRDEPGGQKRLEKTVFPVKKFGFLKKSDIMFSNKSLGVFLLASAFRHVFASIVAETMDVMRGGAVGRQGV